VDFLSEFGIKLLMHGVNCSCCDKENDLKPLLDIPVLDEQDKYVDVILKKQVNIGESSTSAALTTPEDVVTPLSLSVDTTDTSSVGHDTPITATDKLFYGANSFESHQIVVAKGYFLEIDPRNAVMWNLYLHRTRGEHMRVAQIGVDGNAQLIKHKSIKNKNGLIRVDAGVFAVQPDSDGDFEAEFYFLSKM